MWGMGKGVRDGGRGCRVEGGRDLGFVADVGEDWYWVWNRGCLCGRMGWKNVGFDGVYWEEIEEVRGG